MQSRIWVSLLIANEPYLGNYSHRLLVRGDKGRWIITGNVHSLSYTGAQILLTGKVKSSSHNSQGTRASCFENFVSQKRREKRIILGLETFLIFMKSNNGPGARFRRPNEYRMPDLLGH